MGTTIVFGSKKLGKAVEAVSNEKYKGRAVVTVEAFKGKGKTRRILFNNTASSSLGLEQGHIQRIVFAHVIDEDGARQVLVTNEAAMGMDTSEMETYKTSKNSVAYLDSKEKGKGIMSSHICSEIFNFLEAKETSNAEFSLTPYTAEGIEFECFLLGGIDEISAEPTVSEQVVQAVNEASEEIEEIAQEVTAEDVQEIEVQSEEIVMEEETAEEEGSLQAVAQEENDWI